MGAGVNAQSGWYDANKRFDGVDDYLCWAAAASNVLSWWQDRNAELAIASGAPLGNDAIWSDFVKSFGNWNKDKRSTAAMKSMASIGTWTALLTRRSTISPNTAWSTAATTGTW